MRASTQGYRAGLLTTFGGYSVSTVSPEIWIATIAGLVAIVVLDLTVIARRNQVVTIKVATKWVVFYIALAGLFALALGCSPWSWRCGGRKARASSWPATSPSTASAWTTCSCSW